MFRWSGRNLTVMVAPWAAVSQQRYTCVDVLVAEETSPSYALAFTATLLETGETVQRRLTKQLMAQTFERTISEPEGQFAAMRTRVVGKAPRGFDDAVDTVIRDWIGAKAARPPTREQLVLWFLSRMLLVRVGDGWTLEICGEQEADVADVECDITIKKDSWSEKEAADDELRPNSPPPPPYSAGSARSIRSLSSADSENFDHDDAGDQEVARDQENEERQSEEVLAVQITQSAGQQTVQNGAQKRRAKEEYVKERRETLASTNDGSEPTVSLAGKSPYRFEPATVRIKSHRSLSIGLTPTTNAWSEERHHFELELAQSRRDIEIAQERQRKAEAIAALRRKQTIEQNQKKLLVHEQKLQDSRVVKQSIADALEYHDISRRMESQLKQTRISASREQERLSQSMRVALGRSGDKWRKGPVLGTGPLSQIEIDVLTKKRRESEQTPMWVYDLHGRRHHHTNAGSVTKESVFESAMKKIQRLLLRETRASVDMFRQYDLDNSGTLEYGELKELLERNGVSLSAKQATMLFAHFDPNKSGAIDYGELLWGFFNRRAFIKRWKQRKSKLSAREIKMIFYKYDRTGRGALSPTDFQIALDDIGFRVIDEECKLLCVKFDTNKDGFIDYNEFHAFVNDDEDGNSDHGYQDAKKKAKPVKDEKEYGSHSKRVISRRHSLTAPIIKDGARLPRSGQVGDITSMVDMERILVELRELNVMQEEIQRLIK